MSDWFSLAQCDKTSDKNVNASNWLLSDAVSESYVAYLTENQTCNSWAQVQSLPKFWLRVNILDTFER